MNRFVSSDGGSAASRLEMLELFDDLSWSDLLLGAPPGFLESMQSRAAELGGLLTVESAPRAGAVVRVEAGADTEGVSDGD